MPPFAHSAPEGRTWEPLSTPFGEAPGECRGMDCRLCQSLEPEHGHLNKVAFHCATFASTMFHPGPDCDSAKQWGRLAGLWHDLGKFAGEWQRYLQSKSDIHADEISGKVDHSTAGARHAVKIHPTLGHLLAYPIAGHHSGLLDATSNHTCQAFRLRESIIPDCPDSPAAITDHEVPMPPAFLAQDGYSISLFVKMLFSCLVDADFLATEAFMNPVQARLRNQVPEGILAKVSRLIDEKIDSFGVPSPGDTVNFQRRVVVENCRAAALNSPGIFSLTVPTGGGKTLSSLSFALRHALAHGQRRVIYVVPFTSIIEQNADVIREILSPLQSDSFTPLIEHHSALSPEKETTRSRLASENWDAPIIITTAVQFYESLYAAKTSRCRKLHNIANSVVILDEAQSLPVDFLAPCLKVIQELADHYWTTTVLCTATQPAIQYDKDEFPIGLRNCREIIADPAALFAALKRVELESLGDLPDAELAGRLNGHSQVLCIVNRRKHAQQLFQMLDEQEGNFHLSALMCPEHRSGILAKVRSRLRDGLPTRAVSTQLIEAGVDVDFPVVYRALAGLDSIAQAAGRCNRNGKLAEPGRTFIFRPEDQAGETYFRETAQVAHQLIDLHSDLLGREAIHHYFDLYYYQQSKRWDSKGILEEFRLDVGDPSLPFRFQFATAAANFRLIEDGQVPVIIPFDEEARALICQLRNPEIPLHRDLLRALQRYTVSIPPRLRDDNIRSFEVLRDGQFHSLVSTDLNYSNHFGLTFDEGHSGSRNLICDQ
ncbi:CRISPR-associated endonuclease Cas3'' [Luteolibacter sp. Populi]|uniref:CRISPR-associated endonuclease Cas3'' n=1 Tax=Luteolibacter sp. Populi TaxID=3230487 RepID=UPI00346506FA